MRKREIEPEVQSTLAAMPMALRNFSIDEAAAVIGCGRSYAFELIRNKKLKSFLLGKRRIIAGVHLQAYLADCAARSD